MTVVKICGITHLNDALAAAEAGADMLGFIFYPPSPRAIDPADAGAITEALRRAMGPRRPCCVGVFVDTPPRDVRRTIKTAHLDMVQLHGSESASMVGQLGPRAFKAVRPRTVAEAVASLETYRPTFVQPADHPNLLADAYHPKRAGGTGVRADTDVARALARECRLLLAGGLTPDNVREAIAAVAPWGVDVASGVEAHPGVKDYAKVRAFIDAVRAQEQDNEAPISSIVPPRAPSD